MRFVARALRGLAIFAVSVALLGLGVWRIDRAVEDARGSRSPPARERAYAVEVAPLVPHTVRPVITAYGEVRAWRMLEIRAAAAGPITELSPDFRDGASIAEGELLFRVDPTDYERRVRDAKAALAQAETDFAESKEAYVLAAAESRIAKSQLELKNRDLDRKLKLKGKGYVAQTALDDARNAVAEAQQTLSTRMKAELTARVQIQSGQLAVKRARIALEEAKKSLADTAFDAPFAGPLTDVVATLGRRVQPNEKLGTLIDPRTLEVSFRVTDAEFGRLLQPDDTGALKRLPITARLDLGERRIEASGTIERAAAVSNLAKGGRVVFASIAAKAGTVLRPGDFVTVEVAEEPIENVAVVPASAASQDGRIFVVGADNRVEEVKGRVLRRQERTLVVAGLPFGRNYVIARPPYLATGVAVRPRVVPDPDAAPATIALTDTRRQALVAYVEGLAGTPEALRKDMLARLADPMVPREMVERLEAAMKGAAPPEGRPVAGARPASAEGGDMIALSEPRRAALVAWVKASRRMPDNVRERLLAGLARPMVPRAMVERLEARMNGRAR